MLRRLAALALAFNIGSACAGGSAAWPALASQGQLLGPTQVADATRLIDALPAKDRSALQARLDGLAALAPGVEGVKQAGALVRQGTSELAAAPVKPGGASGVQSAWLRGATCVLHGLVYLSGQRVASSTAPDADAALLLRAVREDLKVFPGSAPGELASPPELERELRLGLGPELYLRVASGR